MRLLAPLRIPIAIVLFALGVMGWVMAFVWDSPPLVTATDAYWGLSFSASLTVGVLVSIRVRGNIFGWLLVVGSGALGWGIALEELGRPRVGENLFGAGIISLLSALVVFPTGRYANASWKWAHIVAVVFATAIPQLVPSLDGIGMAALLVVALGSLINRVVVGTAIERRQVGLPVYILIAGFALTTLTGWAVPDVTWLSDISITLVTIGFPVSIGVSIFRYRLFEIDRIISRTVGYALVVGVLGLVYVLGAVWLPSRLTGDSPLFVAGSTLAVAALFNPVRRRVVRSVDRRFYRSRYDAEHVVEEFSGRLRSETDVGRLAEDWVSVVTDTMQPSSVGVWVRAR